MTDEVIPWLERFGPERPSEKEEREEFLKLARECSRSLQEYDNLIQSGVDVERADTRSKWQRANHLYELARTKAVVGLAVDRCWVLGVPFTIAQLRGRRQRRDYLPFVKRIGHVGPLTFLYDLAGAPAAILSSCWPSHLGQCMELAGLEGLMIEELPLSFHNPEHTIGLLYRKRREEV